MISFIIQITPNTMKTTIYILWITSMIFSCEPQMTATLSAQLNIENGTIEGLYNDADSLHLFLGIPYAKPPIGELRWKAPQPLENWEGIKFTKKFGNRPMQKRVFDDIVFRSENQSEDCLFLNVWTPAITKGDKLPVLVYFHGGGLFVGSGDENRYDGASMAKKGIVVVTVNYRLNIFGNFAHPELSAEAEYKASGNYGYLDQVASLEWVRENIGAFGGDPSKVTIAGESAGSVSVSSLITSPLSRDLVAGAIGQSGAAIHPTMPPIPLEEAEKDGVAFAKQFGYNSIEGLRALSTEEAFDLFVESGRWGFQTVMDNYFYRDQVTQVYASKQHADIPLLLGWTSAEVNGQGFLAGDNDLKTNFESNVKNTFPDHWEMILSKYPTGSDDEIMQSATRLASDNFIVYSTWKWADIHNKNGSSPVYRYVFDKTRPTDQPLLGAPHASDIEYLMGNLHLVDLFDWRKEDYEVSKVSQQHLANFIKTGNPNAANIPDWPALPKSKGESNVMIWNTNSKTMIAEYEERFMVLDKVYAGD